MRVYLDHNATTPLHEAVAEAMGPWLSPGTAANPSSIHAEGRAARAAVEEARRRVLGVIGAEAGLFFTSGATEANAIVLRTAGLGHVVTTSIEHSSVLRAVPGEHTRVGADRLGRVDPTDVAAALTSRTVLCSVHLANNVLGTVQDVPEIARACRERSVPLHVDAAQALGRLPVDVSALGCDMASFSAHKVNGPAGVGALWVHPGLSFRPAAGGGLQERGVRPGTENVSGIVGFGAAASRVPGLLARVEDLRARTEALWRGLMGLGGARRLSPAAGSLPNTLCVAFDGVEAETLLMALDLAGVAASAGAACTAGLPEQSHVFLALGLGERTARSAVRLSLGHDTTDADVAYAVSVTEDCVRRCRRES